MNGRRTRPLLALLGVLLACGAPAAHAASPAAERAADEVFSDYATDGRISPCRHSARTLAMARDNVTPDVEQYASEYPGAIEAAIAARARGSCAATGAVAPATTPVPTPAASATPTPQAGAPTATVVPVPPAPAAGAATPAPTPAGGDPGLARAARAQPAADAPLPLVALGALAVLALALVALVLAARRLGLGDERLAPVGHAWREAQWRWQGTWEDFRDWLARGR